MLQELTVTTDKHLHTQIKDYAIYNQVANKRIVNWLKTNPTDLLNVEVPSSLSSVKQTLVHIWQVELSWFACLTNTSPLLPYEQTSTASAEEIFEGLLEQSEKFADYILDLEETELKETTHVYIPHILDCNIPRFELIQLCFDHSTYHRVQITNMARHIGLTDPPITNYMYYLSRERALA
ncbi:DinB family protein [Emticicia agri]|uniref:Damage-inducible protein DinB n=1 Tax=Emticicia agri TaxID=2492393 RepID=A0A4Q5M0L1_9BACT|nr:DinB family protein [Emticicia agri]RYU95519.1 damage-inducible protein DinB [Emticicia agri]